MVWKKGTPSQSSVLTRKRSAEIELSQELVKKRKSSKQIIEAKPIADLEHYIKNPKTLEVLIKKGIKELFPI